MLIQINLACNYPSLVYKDYRIDSDAVQSMTVSALLRWRISPHIETREEGVPSIVHARVWLEVKY